MELDSKIYVAGHKGLAGSAIVRKLISDGYTNIVTKPHSELDLMDQVEVASFFNDVRPEYVFLAAAKVGGILANDKYSADFIYENLQIQNNVIHNSYTHGVKKILFLGSNCIYPKICPQPIKEEYLLTAPLEPTNDAYAIAKIAGIKMCQSYRKQYGFNAISLMPANLYGINDNLNLETSHVFAAIICKFLDAKKNNKRTVELFGDGSALREFLHSDDLADACVFMMNNYNEDVPVNVASNEEYSIKEMAEIIKKSVGYDGEIFWNMQKPNGTPRKKLDLSLIKSIGWEPKTSLSEGISKTLDWYIDNV